MEQLRCVVERITYQNETNGYTVIKCRAKGFTDLVTVVGTMAEVYVGSVLSLSGWWKVDGKYGRQFSVGSYEETLPATVLGLEKFLGSGLIKGIGPKFAHRIVATFEKETLRILETEPDRLIEVPGIGAKRVERIKTSWEQQKEIKNIMLFLQGHQVSTAHATKIYKEYGNESISVVKENPYRLADDIWGIGFKTADGIAEKLGFGHDRYERLRSGILYTLNRLADSGHCFATKEQLLESAAELLTVEQEPLTAALDQMLTGEDIIRDGDAIYLPPFYHSEVGCAKQIRALIADPPRKKITRSRVEEIVSAATEIQYNETQLNAILTAANSPMMVLTGGPGTGKTTTTLGIISVLQHLGKEVLLAAPTGRAAKRLSESTDMEAKTIHRLLEFKPPDGYQRGEENPLEGDALIVDECSMIDILLMYNLLKAVPEHMKLILVGDTDQLPSVGAGNVLKDVIASGIVPVVRLTQIFRQAMGSKIITNAHRINQGQTIDLSNGRDSDFFFDARKTPEDTANRIVELCRKNLPAYYHVDPLRDIQVLTPMQRGVIGAANLNQVLQQAMNPQTLFLKRGGLEYRLRDKVMQIKNDYDKEVFNGDIGTITAVNLEDRELTVVFDDREVVYDATELDELVLAYATTIHKAQGSEYPIVVMPIMMTHYVMLQRNLIYTGVTRAKKVLIIVGEAKAIYCAIKNDKTQLRNTRLAERLREARTFEG